MAGGPARRPAPGRRPGAGHGVRAADGGVRLLAQVVAALEHEGVEISDIGLRRPTLDEVFLALTGDGPRGDGRVVVGAGGPSEKEW